MIKYFAIRVWKLCHSRLFHILYFNCGLILMGREFVSVSWRVETRD